MAVPLRALHPTNGVRIGSRTQSAAHKPAQIIGDNVMVANAAILAASRIVSGWHRRVSVALGAFGLLSFVPFIVELPAPSALPLGVLERCSVYSITAWQLFMAAWLLSRRPTL